MVKQCYYQNVLYAAVKNPKKHLLKNLIKKLKN